MSSTPTLTVRPRRATDLAGLGEALARVYEIDGYPVEGVKDAQGWLQPSREIAAWTALCAGQPVGHVSLTEATVEDDAARLWADKCEGSLADIAVVVRLFVHPQYRGHGAGKELMRAAYEHASSLGKRLVFDVMLKDRQAIGLYEGLGCKRLGLITHCHSDGLTEPAAVYMAPAAAVATDQ